MSKFRSTDDARATMGPATGQGTAPVYHPPGAIRVPGPTEFEAAAHAADAHATNADPSAAPYAPDAAPAAAGPTAAEQDAYALNPALAPTEWHVALASPDRVSALFDEHVQAAAALPPEQAVEHLQAAVALANHLLPEDHPRKITWGTVDALRSALVVYHDAVGSTFGELGQRRHPWRAMANTTAALGSLLPPRQP